MVFFVAIVVVPLLAAGLLVRGAIAREVARTTDLRLQGDTQALSAAWITLDRSVAKDARDVAQGIAPRLGRTLLGPSPQLQALLASSREQLGLDYLILRTGNQTAAASIADPSFLAPGITFSPEAIMNPGPLAPLLIPASVPLERDGQEIGRVYAGLFLDQNQAAELSQTSGRVQFEVRVGNKVAAAAPSLRGPLSLPPPQETAFAVSGKRRAMFTKLVSIPGVTEADSFVVVRPVEQNVGSLQEAILLVLAGSVVIATILGYGLARLIAEPIRRLADQASAALPAARKRGKSRPADEVTDLATTFSAMTEHLHEAERLSMTDALTGAGNRRFLEMTLGREVERARRYGRGLAVLMADVDRFKNVNDLLGHDGGDQVLVDLCRRMETSIRADVDTLVRYGGEEFVVVLPESNEEGAVAAAERMREVVGSTAFGAAEAEALNVTISVGVACYPRDGQTAEDLVRAADLSMYRAKRLGRNRVAAAFLG